MVELAQKVEFTHEVEFTHKVELTLMVEITTGSSRGCQCNPDSIQ